MVSWNRFYPMLREDSFLRMEGSMNAVMRRVAKDKGVLLIDAAKAMPSGPMYFGDFVHFNDKGSAAFSRIVADDLAQRLRAQAPAALPSR
jgi:lysophospholipase L1-like esterase